MFGEMKLRPVYTETEKVENRRRWIEDLDSYRTSMRHVGDMSEVIRILEDNAGVINDVMQDKEVNGQYSPWLQSAFNETMDVLVYLKT